MLTSHELLLQYRHDPSYIFSMVTVCYIDRGAPGDRTCVDGSDIRHLESYYFEIGSGKYMKYIPNHRIRKITYAGEPVWER